MTMYREAPINKLKKIVYYKKKKLIDLIPAIAETLAEFLASVSFVENCIW